MKKAHTTCVRRRATRVALRAAAISALTAGMLVALQSSALASQTNTFSGQCSNVDVTSYFSPALTLTSTFGTQTATLSGGSCSGTVNGRAFQNLPLSGEATFHGIDSCNEATQTSGTAHFLIDGEDFYATQQYQREGTEIVVDFHGDAGGEFVHEVHARAGLIPADSPLAQYLGSPFVEPTWGPSEEEQCAGSGVSEAHGVIKLAQTVGNFSSPPNG